MKTKLTKLQEARWKNALEVLGMAIAYIVCLVMMIRSFGTSY
jgi:hypothetical protein